ncbi:MAG: glycosyltransferase family 4 protein [Deltaproteobacteria bacterium]|nr:glycosyltransferase family 4 protein [Deltaproteobacteria bacterium]
MSPPVPRLELVLSSGIAIGGLERLVYHLAKRLSPRRLEVSVRLVGARGSFAEWMLRVLPARVRWYERSAKGLTELGHAIARGRPGVVHASGLFARAISFAAAPLAPVVDTVANPDLEHGTIRRYAYRGIGRQARAYWADSEARKRAGVQRFGIPEDRVRVIYPGVDPIEVSMSSKQETLRRFELDPRAKLVSIVGNLRVLKGHDRVVNIARPVLQAHPDALFVLAGADLSDGEIPRILRQSSVADRVRWLGFVEDPLPLMAASRLVLQPSRSEGVPRVTLEAMSVGAAIVSTRVGGIPEVLSDGRTGVLVPGDSTDALTRATIELLDDADRRRALGEAARVEVANRFGLDRMVNEFEELYTSVV